MTDVTGTITYPPLERNEFTFVVLEPAPDPRDARIAELEAAGRRVTATAKGLADLCHEHERRAAVAQARIAQLEAALGRIVLQCDRCLFGLVRVTAQNALMPSPEGDMAVTVEELDA